jgi:hypothetical protein
LDYPQHAQRLVIVADFDLPKLLLFITLVPNLSA